MGGGVIYTPPLVYISLAILYRKYTWVYENDFTAHAAIGAIGVVEVLVDRLSAEAVPRHQRNRALQRAGGGSTLPTATGVLAACGIDNRQLTRKPSQRASGLGL